MLKIYNWSKYKQIWPASGRCVLCQAAISGKLDLCQACLEDLPGLQQACNFCGLALGQNGICGACLKEPPPFKKVLAPFHYGPPVDYMIQQLKFHRKLYYARILAQLMLPYLKNRLQSPPECLIPVPLHWRRLWQRSFNQSLEIARHLGRELNIPVDYKSLKRIKHTPQQVQLSAVQRRKNLKDAFKLSRAIAYEHIALVDDVMTTKQTAWELATLLKKNGVRQVDVWVLARVDLGS